MLSAVIGAKLFKFSSTLNKVLGIWPWYNNEKRKFSFERLNRIYVTVCTCIFFALLIPVESLQSKEDNIIENILSILNLLILVTIAGIVVFDTTFLNKNSWRNYIGIFMENLHFEFYATYGKYFVVGNAMFIVVASVVLYSISHLDGDYWFYIVPPAIILEYYCFQVTLTIVTMTSGISLVYEHLIKTLKQKTISPLLPFLNNFDTDRLLICHILEVEKRYIRVSELVQCFNEVEGIKFILIFWRSFVELLRTVNFILFKYQNDLETTNEMLFGVFVLTGFTLVSIFYVYLSCL